MLASYRIISLTLPPVLCAAAVIYVTTDVLNFIIQQ